MSRGDIESVTVALPPAGILTRAKSTSDSDGVSTAGLSALHRR